MKNSANDAPFKRQSYWRLLKFAAPYWKRLTFGILCGIIASLGIGFLCMIVTAVGQHHPPKINDEDMIVEDSLLEVVEDSLEVTDSEAP